MRSSVEYARQARIVFVAAAGPRWGYGHLVRCISFAHALGVRPLMIVRGEKCVVETALALGADVVPNATPATLEAFCPDVVIVDDPVEAKSQRWIAAARRSGALVVTVRDRATESRAASLAAARGVTRAPRRRYVRIELDRRLRLKLAAAIADAIAVAEPDAKVRITGGFVAPTYALRASASAQATAHKTVGKAPMLSSRSRSSGTWSVERVS